MSYVIGIDVGGTNIKTVAVSITGALLFQRREPTEEDRIDWAERIRQQIKRIESQQNGPAAYIGLAAPGLAAPDGRCIAWMQGRMEAVQGLDWTLYLGAAQTIPVLNDAQAALLGEVWKGAAIGCRNVVLLTLGTGVGGGALVDGRLLRGHLGRAGHLGHICLDPQGKPDIVGTPGSLEDAIGDCTLRERTQGRFASTEQLVQAYLAGDAEASAVWQRSLQALACGIVSLINTLDPEVVILGGGIIQAGSALFDPLEALLDRFEWRPTGSRVRIVPALLGDFAGAFGAACHALQVNAALPASTTF
ncbi:MAG TPA: ROK family protein [Chthonomonadaceae bacterium]|nr:ROK family protein [Chthonomonadaceae bacterium]